MLTIFSTPKPFRGHFKEIQMNALQSWAAIRPSCEILLIGEEDGVEAAAKMVGARYLPQIARNDSGTPLVCSLFEEAKKRATHNLLCYANADIIFFNDLLDAIRVIWLKSFLLTGRRIDFDLKRSIDFNSSEWASQLRIQVQDRGTFHPPTGSDFFVFPKDTLPNNIPTFSIGRPGWDNWMIYEARRLNIPVVDGSETIMAVHQNHDYSHHREGSFGVWQGWEARQNLDLVHQDTHDFHLRDATWLLSNGRLKRAWTKHHIRRHLHTVPLFHPWLRPVARFAKKVRNSLMKKVEIWRSA